MRFFHMLRNAKVRRQQYVVIMCIKHRMEIFQNLTVIHHLIILYLSIVNITSIIQAAFHQGDYNFLLSSCKLKQKANILHSIHINRKQKFC